MAETNLPELIPAELIQVVQLPVIKEYLHSMKESVDQRVAAALSMVCTEETIQAVKSERAAMNREFSDMEDRRKSVKAAIMKPYEEFEATYKECVSDAYKCADASLKGKISDVESEQKRRCEEGLRSYFLELCEVHHLDWLKYEQAGIRVDMASAKAKTPVKLRKQLAEFIVRVNDGVNLVNSMENAEEIMVEFRKTLDAAQAIGVVKERHRRIEDERAAKEARETVLAAQEKAEQRVIQVQKSYLQPPIVAAVKPEKDPEETIPQMTFTVYDAPRRVLWKIRDILREEGIRYG